MYKKFISILSAWSAVALLMLGLSPVAHGATATIYNNDVTGSNQGPVDLVQGADGNIWYTLGSTGYVGVMGPNCGVINNINLGGNPASITYAQTDGNYYVTVNTTGKIAKISPAGAIVYQAAAGCVLPGDIIEDPVNHYIWYTCVDTSKVKAIDPATGNSVGTEITSGANPTGLTACNGRLWFTELNGNSIGVADTDGTNYTSHAVTGTLPWEITCGPDGNLWYTLKGTGNIQSMDKTSYAVLQTFSPPTLNSWPFGITTGPDGNLWFAERTGNNIARMTTAGVFTEFALKTAGSLPLAVISGPGGNIYFTENGNNAIGKLVVSSINSGGGTTPSAPNTSSLVNKTNAVPIAAGVLALLATLAVAGFWIKSEFKNKK